MKPNQKTLSLVLKDETIKALEEEAEKCGLKLAVYIRTYLENMIRNHGLITMQEKKS